MLLQHPFEITPSLLPGVKIGGAWVSIAYAGRPGTEGRTRYRWEIVLPSGRELVGDDLQSGVGGGGLQEGMSSLLSFLSAFAEAGEDGENADLFPGRLREWAQQNSDEIACAQMAVDETEDCLIE